MCTASRAPKRRGSSRAAITRRAGAGAGDRGGVVRRARVEVVVPRATGALGARVRERRRRPRLRPPDAPTLVRQSRTKIFNPFVEFESSNEDGLALTVNVRPLMIPDVVVPSVETSTARWIRSPGARSEAPSVNRLVAPAPGIVSAMCPVEIAPWFTDAVAVNVAPAVSDSTPIAHMTAAPRRVHHHGRLSRDRALSASVWPRMRAYARRRIGGRSP